MSQQVLTPQWGSSIVQDAIPTKEMWVWMDDLTTCVNSFSSGSGTVSWGNINGDITLQTDLVAYVADNYLAIGAAAGGDLTGTYPSPELASIGSAETAIRANISIDAKGRVTSLSGESIRVISDDYDTIGNEWLLLGKRVTVTLNPSPDDLEIVRVKAAATGGFKVVSSKAMDGRYEINYSKPFIERNFIYSSELDGWRVF